MTQNCCGADGSFAEEKQDLDENFDAKAFEAGTAGS